MAKKIKTAIVLDPMGGIRGDRTPDDEAKELKSRFEEMLGRKLNVHRPNHAGDIEVGTELVLFDFGGMLPGAESLMESNARHLIKWAEEHTSALVIVVSHFTFTRYVKPEMEALGLTGLPNLVLDDPFENPDGPIPAWWKV